MKKKPKNKLFASYGECLHILKSKNHTKCGIVNKWKTVSNLRPQKIENWNEFYCMDCFPKHP